METEGAGAEPPEASGGLDVYLEHESLSLREADVRALADRIAAGENVRWHEVGIILGDHALVHDLNREWLGHDWETDVVSFPLDEEARARGVIEGEVYVDLDTAREVAPEVDATFEHEALRYVAHGLLHLVGYDDATDEERAVMRGLEDRYLAG
ncbi:rRNA maturation RNase YbeY [Rubricoccus marinus]|uniref:Endoribonuclease YbeY n=1 Tax=Rubricoccus marinus TaxID=716817 RepID=A0A259U062_9BACT|nr:rRNA maturation RNase YbeY [Rubricoccus marinus]OZC03227.1 rRNA maturation RNase YbeY [Rubricoccus marinus]